MKTENQKTKEEIKALAEEKYGITARFSSHNRKIGFVEGFTQCQESYATLPAQSSDAVEFAEWIKINRYVMIRSFGVKTGVWLNVNSKSTTEYTTSDLYSIFLKEKGAHNG